MRLFVKIYILEKWIIFSFKHKSFQIPYILMHIFLFICSMHQNVFQLQLARPKAAVAFLIAAQKNTEVRYVLCPLGVFSSHKYAPEPYFIQDYREFERLGKWVKSAPRNTIVIFDWRFTAIASQLANFIELPSYNKRIVHLWKWRKKGIRKLSWIIRYR